MQQPSSKYGQSFLIMATLQQKKHKANLEQFNFKCIFHTETKSIELFETLHSTRSVEISHPNNTHRQ